MPFLTDRNERPRRLPGIDAATLELFDHASTNLTVKCRLARWLRWPHVSFEDLLNTHSCRDPPDTMHLFFRVGLVSECDDLDLSAQILKAALS
jgi:hypothetical protein